MTGQLHCNRFSIKAAVVSDSETPRPAARQAPLSSISSQSFLKFISIVSVTLSNHSSSATPSPFAFSFSQHQGFSQWSRHYLILKSFSLQKKKALLYLVFCIQQGKKDYFQIKPKTTLTQTVTVNKFMKKNFKFMHSHRTEC